MVSFVDDCFTLTLKPWAPTNPFSPDLPGSPYKQTTRTHAKLRIDQQQNVWFASVGWVGQCPTPSRWRLCSLIGLECNNNVYMIVFFFTLCLSGAEQQVTNVPTEQVFLWHLFATWGRRNRWSVLSWKQHSWRARDYFVYQGYKSKGSRYTENSRGPRI